jgi:post-segregation antitoxin (ccd killing protein)
VYGLRMARVNITMPDELHERARAAGLNVSRLAQAAVAAELERRDKIAELDAYLRDLDSVMGPLADDERRAAEAWVASVLGPPGRRSA